MATSTDEAELLELIHRNRIAAWTQDYDLYQSCFVHAPYATRWNASRRTGIFVRESWDEISERVRLMFSTEPHLKIPANGYDATVENLVLRIDGDIAWARYNQRYPGIPSRVHNRAYSREIRIFERHDGQWKIAFLGYLDDEPGPDDRIFIQLDSTGRVVWQGQAAAAILAADGDLTIRSGHLRIRDTAVDRRLQAAIRWAAERDKTFLPSRGAVPIVLAGGLRLPAILPASREMHALLWDAHFYLAMAFFALVLVHIAAALFHLLVRRDEVFKQMTVGTE